MASNHKPEIRIVLVGKTGAGKSAAGNIILGRMTFRSRPSLTSVTLTCQKESTEFEGQRLAVIDTPSLLDTRVPNDEVVREIARCISLAAPGPHVFLLVLQLARMTRDEQDAVKIIQTMFGNESGRYTMILFTHGDDLGEGDSVEQLIRESTDLAGVIRECCGYHVFNNQDQNPSQVRELLKKINSIVQRNGGGHYTNGMFEEAERAIQKEMRREIPRQAAERNNAFIQNAKRNVFIMGAFAALGFAVGGPVGAAAGVVAGAAVDVTLSRRPCTIQ